MDTRAILSALPKKSANLESQAVEKAEHRILKGTTSEPLKDNHLDTEAKPRLTITPGQVLGCVANEDLEKVLGG